MGGLWVGEALSTEPDSRKEFTFLGGVGSASFGLLSGTLYFASGFPPPTSVFEIWVRYTLGGLGPLIFGVLALGPLVLRLMRRFRPSSVKAAFISIPAAGLVGAVVSVAVAAIARDEYLGVLIAVGIPVIWTSFFAVGLLRLMSRFKALSLVVITAVLLVSLAGWFSYNPLS